MSIIEVNNVSKEFKLGQLKSLKHTFTSNIQRLMGKDVESTTPFKALDNVDFRVEQGEVLGIIGHNGAGKSTLLKLLARISVPTKGNVKVNGTVAPLIEVGAGLIGDLTGRENIYLNGTILGMSRAEIKRKFDEIVTFAELEDFIDTPIKRYSSGMAVRLGFAVATSVDADILIVDEVLAVGDIAFQRKCFDRMEDMIKRQGKTVLIVSHNIRQVTRLCSRAILLGDGRVLNDGNPLHVANRFYEISDNKIHNSVVKSKNIDILDESCKNYVSLIDIKMYTENNNETYIVEYNSNIFLDIEYHTSIELINPVFAIGVHTTDLLYLTANRSERQISNSVVAPGTHKVRCTINKFPLMPGVYSLRMSIGAGIIRMDHYYGENLLPFQVVNTDAERIDLQGECFFKLDAEWEYIV